jgi:hypothetical protein
MRRSLLVTVAALGALVCAIGGTGLFAALTDTARSGTNSAESAQLAGSADIQVATATTGASGVACGAFSEDLTTAFITVSDLNPGQGFSGGAYCMKNVGSQQVTLSALSDELTDVDYACTGDEALHGDTTCGADAAGEFSSVLRVNYTELDCATASGPGSSPFLKDNAITPHPLGTLAVGQTRCFATSVFYSPTTPTVEVQKAQSDRVTWRHKWVAQA